MKELPDPISPVWDSPCVALAMSSSQQYAPYLCVCLQSIKEHADPACKYDIVIFTSEMNEETKRIITEHISNEHISVRYVNPKKYFEHIPLFISHSYFKEECYYRLVAPLIFKQYQKVLFTDIDLIFTEDVQKLYHTDLAGKPIAATIDLLWHGIIRKTPSLETKYARETLGLADPYKYVNTGVMLMDIASCLTRQLPQATLALVSSHKYETQEQCAINAFLKEDICYLDPRWNVAVQPQWVKEIMTHMPAQSLATFQTAYSQAKVWHFMGGAKPWDNLQEDKSTLWWQYARRTPFYEQILYRLYVRPLHALSVQSHEAFAYPRTRWSYWRAKWLSKMTCGEKKKHYQNKKTTLKRRIQIGKILRKKD